MSRWPKPDSAKRGPEMRPDITIMQTRVLPAGAATFSLGFRIVIKGPMGCGKTTVADWVRQYVTQNGGRIFEEYSGERGYPPREEVFGSLGRLSVPSLKEAIDVFAREQEQKYSCDRGEART